MALRGPHPGDRRVPRAAAAPRSCCWPPCSWTWRRDPARGLRGGDHPAAHHRRRASPSPPSSLPGILFYVVVGTIIACSSSRPWPCTCGGDGASGGRWRPCCRRSPRNATVVFDGPATAPSRRRRDRHDPVGAYLLALDALARRRPAGRDGQRDAAPARRTRAWPWRRGSLAAAPLAAWPRPTSWCGAGRRTDDGAGAGHARTHVDMGVDNAIVRD